MVLPIQRPQLQWLTCPLCQPPATTRIRADFATVKRQTGTLVCVDPDPSVHVSAGVGNLAWASVQE